MRNEIVGISLFDLAEAQRRKEDGIARAMAAGARQKVVELAREIARNICIDRGRSGPDWVTSDDVARAMDERGIPYDQLGNAAGAIFRSDEFEPTGEFRQSVRVGSHARMIRVWRLKCPARSLAQTLPEGFA